MSSEDQFSDEEVFIGDITIKEIKKRLNTANYRQTIGYAHTNAKEDSNCSVKIIETHSAPNILARVDLLALSPTITKSESSPGLSPEVLSEWDIKPDDTFLKLERMVSDLNVSPQLQDSNVDSTSDSKGYFFMGPLESSANLKLARLKQEINSPNENSIDTSDKKISELRYDNRPKSKFQLKTPLKVNTPASPATATPTNIFRTPLNDFKRTPIFKTPGNPVSQKKNARFTPSKRYQNVSSPVAAYIKQCPLVPLVTDVCPKKPLPSMSSIPKLVKSKPSSSSKENLKQEHKENVKPEIKLCSKLPSVAYRSAKETKLIKIPDDGKMPQNQWAKEVASSIPRAMIIKHGHREMTSKKPLQQKQEDSFGDLSLHQADLSICTQKSAFNKPKKIM